MRYILLTQSKRVTVDDEDYERLALFKWYFHHTGYAVRNFTDSNKKRKTIFLHREVLGTPKGEYVDHKDCDKLNCQKDNLRPTTYANNNTNKFPQKNNTSGYKGVHQRETGKWRAYFTLKKKRTYIGQFETAIEAARAYNKAALEVWGEFARLNVIDNASK